MKTTDLPLFWVIVQLEICDGGYYLVRLVGDTHF